MRDPAASGYTVLEALVGLLLGWLLAVLVLGTAAAQGRVQGALARQAEVLAAVRTARHVLGQEARGEGADGPRVVARDSLALRSVRGRGAACPLPGAPHLLGARPRGIRAPREGEDSVLVVADDGQVSVHLLLAREADGAACGSGAPTGWERWTLSSPVSGRPVYVHYFQRGSYHLAEGALRYRTRGSGRQPLTPEVLGRGSVFVPHDGGGVSATLSLPGGGWWSVPVAVGGAGG